MRQLGIGAALGAVGAWFLDPSNGKRRRHVTRDKTLAVFRGGARRGERVGRKVASDTYGLKQKATHLRQEPKEYDDATLKAKVETELFRFEHDLKGAVDVNAQHGVVQLRGEIPSQTLIDTLVTRTRAIQGVREVESLLHKAGTPAPMHY
ncbi:MAG: BON domain-containing protein [Gaiellaceae bacterium]